jgi:hypothetical protein
MWKMSASTLRAAICLSTGLLFLLFAMQGVEAGPDELVKQLRALADDEAKKEEDRVKEAAELLKKDQDSIKPAIEKLKAEYDEGKTFFEEEKMAGAAKVMVLFGLACKLAGKTGAYGDIRLTVWQQINDTARNDVMPDEEKKQTIEKLVKMWKPFVPDIYVEIKRQYNKYEAEENTFEMKLQIRQMELLSEAWFKAYGDKMYVDDLATFKRLIEQYQNMTPEQREKIKVADKRLASAIHKFEGQEWVPARDVFMMAYNLYKQAGVKRKIMIAAYWLAVAHEKTKEPWKIKEYLLEAMKLAEELGDTVKLKEMKEYYDSLKAKEEKGTLDLTKSPLTDPKNFPPKPDKVKLRSVSGNKARGPDPHAFEDPIFWRALYLSDFPDANGKDQNKLKLPFPGLHWWLKKGANILYATNVEGRGARSVKLSPKGSLQKVVCDYFYKEKSVKIAFQFTGLWYRSVKVCENIIEYPADNTAYNIRIRSNTFRQGSYQGQQFFISDDNCNGIFRDFGTEENPANQQNNDIFFYGSDGITVGRGRGAYSTILGSVVKFGGKYYKMKLNNPVTEAEFWEYKGPTGKVKLNFRGNGRCNIMHFIVGQKVGAEEIFFVNLGGGGRDAMEVPVGSYFFKYGLLVDGTKPEKNLRVEIRRGAFPPFKVKEGETTTVAFGGDYTFNYPIQFDANTGECEIKTYEMTMTGQKGEIYQNHWPKVFAPDYKVVDKNGRTVHKGRMRRFNSDEELEPQGVGAEILYRHPFHVTFKVRPGSCQPPFKVLISASHPLFGSIRDSKLKR